MVEPSFFPKEMPAPQEHVKKQGVDSELIGKVAKNVNSLAANLKILEERYSNLRNRLQGSEQSLIGVEKEVRDDIKLLSDDVMELKKQMSDINDKLRLISSEIGNLVNKTDFRVVERYLDLWQPMNFITRNELGKLVESKLREKNQPLSPENK